MSLTAPWAGAERAGGTHSGWAWAWQPGDSPAPQGLSIVLADRNYTVSGTDPQVDYRVRADSLHLILDVTLGSSYNLTVVWNKHMTVSIKISRASQVPCAPAQVAGVGRRPPPARPPDASPRRTPCAACAATTTGT